MIMEYCQTCFYFLVNEKKLYHRYYDMVHTKTVIRFHQLTIFIYFGNCSKYDKILSFTNNVIVLQSLFMQLSHEYCSKLDTSRIATLITKKLG